MENETAIWRKNVTVTVNKDYNSGSFTAYAGQTFVLDVPADYEASKIHPCDIDYDQQIWIISR